MRIYPTSHSCPQDIRVIQRKEPIKHTQAALTINTMFMVAAGRRPDSVHAYRVQDLNTASRCAAAAAGRVPTTTTTARGAASPESGACSDPENYLVWDGIHLTDAAYRAFADGWLNGTYCSPGILH
jgi:lysophospholipase L1-like esterase